MYECTRNALKRERVLAGKRHTRQLNEERRRERESKGKRSRNLACNNIQGTDSGGPEATKTSRERRNFSFSMKRVSPSGEVFTRKKSEEESNAMVAFQQNFPSPLSP